MNNGKEIQQVIVPVKLRNQLMELAHSSLMGGHMGIKKTTDRIRGSFFWPGMEGDVKRFSRSSYICQKTVS